MAHVSMILREVLLQKIIYRELVKNYKLAYRKYERKIRGKFMYLIICKHWIRNRKMFGLNRIQYTIKNHLSLNVGVSIETIKGRAMKILRPFLLQQLGLEHFTDCVRKCHARTEYI